MFGQSAFVTMLAKNLVHRVTFNACRCMGKSPFEADDIANGIATTAAATAGSLVSVVTLDIPGAVGSAAYLALEEGERASRPRR